MFGEYLGAGSSVTKGLYHLNGNANDDSGNGANGTPTNVTWVDGILGSGAASFNGTNSKITLPSTVFGSNWTISVWFKFTGTATNKIYFYDQISPSRQLGIGWDNGQNRIEYFHWNGSSVSKIQFTASSFNDGNRHNCIVTNNAGSVIGYIDGVSNVSGSLSNISMTATRNALGVQQAAGVQRYNGQEDEYIVENRTRTPIEIKKYYTYAKGRFGL